MSLDLTMDSGEEMRFLNRINRLVRRLAKKTHFSHRELEICLLIYHKLVKDQDDPAAARYVSRHQLNMVFDTVLGISDNVVAGRIYGALEGTTVTSHITMGTWARMLSLLLRGTLNEKIDHCFRVYDIAGHGRIRREDMMVLLRGCFIKHAQEEVEESIKDLVDILIRRLDEDHDGEISLEDFRTSIRKSPELLECLGQALPDRAHVYAFSRTFLDRVKKF